MEHLRHAIVNFEKDGRQMGLRRAYNKELTGGKRLVGAFNNTKKGEPNVYKGIFKEVKGRIQNCEEACTDHKYFLLHDKGQCACSDTFDEQHGKAKKWEWEYGKKTHGGSKDVNIVYDREEEDSEPTMVGCVRIGKKTNKHRVGYSPL